MALTTSALQIGRNALLAYQSALQIVGSNVSNSANPDYTRQTGRLEAQPGTFLHTGLQAGAGVLLTGLKRNVDEAVEDRLRSAIAADGFHDVQQNALTQVEALFNELTDADLSSQLGEFFNSLANVQNNPTALALRDVSVANGQAVAANLQRHRRDLLNQAEALNEQISALADQASLIAGNIADLNRRITESEAVVAGQSTALRDQRDAELRRLSDLVEITVRQGQPQGSSVNVYVGNETLVQDARSRGLTTTEQQEGAVARTVVRFADSNAQVDLRGGRLAGLVKARDEHVLGRIDGLDQLARGLIVEFNRTHANGQGLTALSDIIGANAVGDPAAPLSGAAAGLDLPPVHGSFYVLVADNATGATTAHQILVDLDGIGDDASLESLVEDINASVTGVTASITPDNRLRLTADPGLSIVFGNDGAQAREDTSGVLAALGINTFFTGSSAADIAVDDRIVADSGLLAAATSNRAGDGSNAGALAGAGQRPSDALGGVSVLDFYNSIANDVAVISSSETQLRQASSAVLGAVQAQRESVSGVNLDEEAIDLLKFERSFQGSARYIRTVDELLTELLNIA